MVNPLNLQRRIPERNAPILSPDDDNILVSAIISTYNSAEFIEGCIRELHKQTIADRIEIIVVDSASPDGEGEIVKKLQSEFSNIRYLRTPNRETVYKAWNRGIKLARGKYITNANTDDRRRYDAIELLVNALENNPQAILAYGNFNVVREGNKPFGKAPAVDTMDYPPYRRGDLLVSCYPGPMPVWRKSVHKEFGLFNPDYTSAGDREFWVRISQKYEMIHVPEVIGDFLEAPDSISNAAKRKGIAKSEGQDILTHYGHSFEKSWDEYRIIKLRVNNNFDEVKQRIENLAASGGGYRLNVLMHFASLEEWAWLAEQKNRGVIYDLVEDRGFSLKMGNESGKLRHSKSTPPAVSLIYFTWNRIEYTQISLPALLENTQYPFELHIVDNGSNDGTPGYLKDMQSLYPEIIKSLTLNETNRGLPQPTNEFWRSVKTDFIGKVDNDTIVPPGWLQKLVEAHEQVPEIGVVAAYHFPLNEVNDAVVKSKVTSKNGISILRDSHVGGCAYLMKKNVQEKTGFMPVDPNRKIMGWTEYQNKITAQGFWIGYYYPLIGLEYLDDPRNENCLIDSKYLEYSRQIWSQRGVKVNSAEDIDKWLRKDIERIAGKSNGKDSSPIAHSSHSSPEFHPQTPSGAQSRKAAMNANKDGKYYIYERKDVAGLVPENAIKILDVGCGGGGLARTLKNENSDRWIAGIELNDAAADQAEEVMDVVIRTDIEAWQPEFAEGELDCIIFADILEHLVDPYSLLKRIRRLLKPDGCVIISLPNIRNYKVIGELLNGRWRYRDAGIMDSTHLRFFTRAEITRLLDQAGFRVDATDLIYNKESPIEAWKKAGRPPEFSLGRAVLKNLAPEEIEDLLAEQILVRGVRQDQPLVSIVIPSYNQADYTVECVKSVIENTRQPYEIIVVDNGSEDDSVENLSKLGYVSLNIITNKENRGFGPACNQGIKAAKGRYIVLLNNDTLVEKGWIEGMISAAEKNEMVGIVGPMSNYVSHISQFDGIARYKNNRQLKEYANNIRQSRAGQAEVVRTLVFFCVMIKREVFDSIGLFDETFAVGNYEDSDFCLRALQAEWLLVVAKDVFIHHFGSRTFYAKKESAEHHERMVKNGQKFFTKWGISPQEYDSMHPRPPRDQLIESSLEDFREIEESVDVRPFDNARSVTEKILSLGVAQNPVETVKTILNRDVDATLLTELGRELVQKHFEIGEKYLLTALELDPLHTPLYNTFRLLEQNLPEQWKLHHQNLAMKAMKIASSNDELHREMLKLTRFWDAPEAIEFARLKLLENAEPVMPESFSGDPEYSIIVPMYNAGKFISATLDSILSQTDPNYDCIIVDDGSNDNSYITTQSWIAERGDERFRVLRQENKGPSAARNYGIENSRGKYIACIDADDAYTPDFLKLSRKAIETAPDIGWVYPLTLQYGKFNRVWGTDEFDPVAFLLVNRCPSSALQRREMWDDIGGFYENMKIGYEDWEYWVNAIEHGWRAVRLPEILFFYRKRQESRNEQINNSGEIQLKLDMMQRHPQAYRKLESHEKNKLTIPRSFTADIILPEFANLWKLRNQALNRRKASLNMKHLNKEVQVETISQQQS
ncbi:glycosyltransferase [Calditrichota bacterium]